MGERARDKKRTKEVCMADTRVLWWNKALQRVATERKKEPPPKKQQQKGKENENCSVIILHPSDRHTCTGNVWNKEGNGKKKRQRIAAGITGPRNHVVIGLRQWL